MLCSAVESGALQLYQDLRKLERQGAERLKIHRKSKVFTSYKVVFVADVGSVLLGLSLHGLALLAALEKAHFLGSQSKFQELRSASGFKRALDPRSKNARVRPARAETFNVGKQ